MYIVHIKSGYIVKSTRSKWKEAVFFLLGQLHKGNMCSGPYNRYIHDSQSLYIVLLVSTKIGRVNGISFVRNAVD